MLIKNSFSVPLPVSAAWQVLNDIQRVVHCAPGAQLVEARPDGSYVGMVRVKLGPVALSFRGVLAYKERNEMAHRVIAEATGNEERARGTARALVTFTLVPQKDATEVAVDTDLQLVGAIAQYGRGSALIQSAAQVLMNEFAANFAAEFGPSRVTQLAAAQSPTRSPDSQAPGSISGFRLIAESIWGIVTFWFRKSGR